MAGTEIPVSLKKDPTQQLPVRTCHFASSIKWVERPMLPSTAPNFVLFERFPLKVFFTHALHCAAFVRCVGSSARLSKLREDGDALTRQRRVDVKIGAMEPVDLPPLRFPLREALLSLQQSAQGPPSVRTALAESASLGSLGPYKVSSTAPWRFKSTDQD